MDLLNQKIIEIWENLIQKDYEQSYILNEDTLKSVLCYHLRNEIEKHPEFENYRVYTECTHFDFMKLTNMRPDIIIAKIVPKKCDGEKIWINDILAIFELKYLSNSAEKPVYRDIDKFKKYIKQFDMYNKCKYYVVAITPYEFNQPNWIDDDLKKYSWTKGKVIELNGYKKNGEMVFKPFLH